MVKDSKAPLPVAVYTPEPSLQHPAVMARALGKDILAGRELAWRLFVRDLSAQYRQTVFGYVWAFLPPIAASLTFIFLNAQGIVNIPTQGIPYPAFAMMGTLLWQVFVDALNSPSQALWRAKPMLAKINFPRESILLAGLYLVIFNVGIRLVLLAAVMAWWGVVPDWGVLLFPVTLAVLIGCGSVVGLLIAPLGALYGDITKGLPIITSFWMLLTPVVYPARSEGVAGWLATWNPVSPIIETARNSLTGSEFAQLPAFVIVALVSLLLGFVGLISFRIAMPHLIARMGG